MKEDFTNKGEQQMLRLLGIKKSYTVGDTVTHALKGIDLSFRKSEFVAILGPSGCGKTTLLNVIGGLDQYDAGDLVINNRSTKEYKDSDWDAYRNHSIGFVFQSYNLIPHQTVLQNVELALSLCGVSKSERKSRAAQALRDVGLEDHLHKKPSEMSGGQIQRVAIARALVNNPDIILADEPTGALDSETSLQVMDILKEISKDRLVIMVTHNPELAEQYATRTVRMLDGEIKSDSAPFDDIPVIEEKIGKQKKKKDKALKKPSMSFPTAFGLSLKNLFTKKGRTTLTAFAGSIGIIGIALIFAVSQGMTSYINDVQEETLTAYPLTLEAKTMDMTSLMQSFMNAGNDHDHPNDAIYKDPIISDLVNALSKLETSENDLKTFKKHLEKELGTEGSRFNEAISGIQYAYNLNLSVYTKNPDGEIIKSDTAELMMEMLGDFMMQVSSNGSDKDSDGGNTTNGMMQPPMMTMGNVKMWQELIPALDGSPVSNVLKEQYDVLEGGRWPENKNEIVLAVNKNNELDDLTLYALGLLSKNEIDSIIDAAATGNTLPEDNKKWSYDEIHGMTFKTIFPYDCYKEFNGIFVDVSENESMLQMLYENAFELKVVGIIRPKEDTEATAFTGAIGYTHELTEYIIEQAKNSPVVKAQRADSSTDILSGLPFKSNTSAFTDYEKKNAFIDYISTLSPEKKAETYVAIQCLNAIQAQMDVQVDAILGTMQDKDAIIAQVSGSIAEQMDVDPQVITAQLAEMELDALKNMLKPSIQESVKAQITAKVTEDLSVLTVEQKISLLENEEYTDEKCAVYYDEITVFSDSTYEQTLVKIGSLDLASPSKINLYASTFENKDIIVEAIESYNSSADESKKIAYTDFLGLMMSSITTIINAISYVLIAFVAISLIVSSIMIGVITLISVQERTKEIGILRAIGASKRNVSSMFNAETVIIGFTSGLLGVLLTYLLCIPINAIIYNLTGIAGLRAQLPVEIALILVFISVILTLFAGIIPSRSAAKKDPVVALRTE